MKHPVLFIFQNISAYKNKGDQPTPTLYPSRPMGYSGPTASQEKERDNEEISLVDKRSNCGFLVQDPGLKFMTFPP